MDEMNSVVVKRLSEIIEKLQAGEAQVLQFDEALGIAEEEIDGAHFMAHDGRNVLLLRWIDGEQQEQLHEKLATHFDYT